MPEGPDDLTHLHPGARRVALLPAEERLRHVRADRWIGYTRATDAIARLETLFSWPDKQRMPNVLLIGPTNNGKSMIVEKFRRMHPPVSHPDHEHIPVLTVPSPARNTSATCVPTSPPPPNTASTSSTHSCSWHPASHGYPPSTDLIS